MFSRYKLPRTLTVFLTVLLSAALLSSCYGIEMQYAASVEPPPPMDSGVSPSPTADPEIVRFTDLIGQVLLLAPEKSGALNGSPLDYLFRPVIEKNTGLSQYSYAKLHLTEPGTPPDTDVTYTGETIWDAETGDASFIAYTQTGAEHAEQAGIWFTGNILTVKKSQDQNPILQHTLVPQVSQSMLALPAFERFAHVLEDTGAVVISQENWEAFVNEYLDTIIENSRALDLSTENGSETYGGVKVSTISESLKLYGTKGVLVTRGLLALLGKDLELKALYNTQLFTDGTQYGVTGLDGALRDIDALDDSDRSTAVTTIRLVEADRPVGIHVTLSAGGKTLSVDLTFYDRGPVSQSDLMFGGFDGSRVVLSQTVTLDGGGFASDFIYDVLSPGAQPQESVSVLTSGTTTDGTLNVTAQFSMTRAASPASGAVLIGGTLTYTQKQDGATTKGTGTGMLNISDSGKAHTYQYDLSVQETNRSVPVEPPAFDASAGLSAATQDGLYQALGDFDGKSFILAPPITRFQAIFKILFN